MSSTLCRSPMEGTFPSDANASGSLLEGAQGRAERMRIRLDACRSVRTQLHNRGRYSVASGCGDLPPECDDQSLHELTSITPPDPSCTHPSTTQPTNPLNPSPPPSSSDSNALETPPPLPAAPPPPIKVVMRNKQSTAYGGLAAHCDQPRLSRCTESPAPSVIELNSATSHRSSMSVDSGCGVSLLSGADSSSRRVLAQRKCSKDTLLSYTSESVCSEAVAPPTLRGGAAAGDTSATAEGSLPPLTGSPPLWSFVRSAVERQRQAHNAAWHASSGDIRSAASEYTSTMRSTKSMATARTAPKPACYESRTVNRRPFSIARTVQRQQLQRGSGDCVAAAESDRVSPVFRASRVFIDKSNSWSSEDEDCAGGGKPTWEDVKRMLDPNFHLRANKPKSRCVSCGSTGTLTAPGGSPPPARLQQQQSTSKQYAASAAAPQVGRSASVSVGEGRPARPPKQWKESEDL